MDPLLPPDYMRRYLDKRYGKYRAIVRDTADPEKLGRVRVLCDEVYGSDLSPWASACVMGGVRMDSAAFFPPPIDALVWVEFEAGDVERPIVSGGRIEPLTTGRQKDGTPIAESEGYQTTKSPLPMVFQGEMDGLELDGGLKGRDGAPMTSFAGRYGYVRGIQTPAGHRLVFDDTPGAERVELRHRLGGGFEVLPDGSITVLSNGTVTESSKDRNTRVEGTRRTEVGGDEVLKVRGNYTLEIDGAYNVRYVRRGTDERASDSATVAGDFARDAVGKVSLSAGTFMELLANDSIQMVAGAGFTLSAGGSGDLLFGNINGNAPAPLPFSDAVRVRGVGRASLSSWYLVPMPTELGIEAVGLAVDATNIPKVGVPGAYVRVGNLTRPMAPDGTPLLDEPAVMGTQLQLYLTQLHQLLTDFITEYSVHVHPSYSPPVTGAVALARLNALLGTLTGTFLTPAAAKARPLLLSDLVYVSKV